MPSIDIQRNNAPEDFITEKEKQVVREFYATVNGDDYSNLADSYDAYGPKYDEVIAILGYNPFPRLAKELVTLFNNEGIGAKKVIDIGAGTGKFGESLWNCGFRNIDGLDLSEKLLEVCVNRKCYKKLFNQPLTRDRIPGVADNTYDAAVSSGSYIEGHIPMDTLEELTRIVKPGGYLLYTLHDPNFTMDYMEWHGKIMKQKKAELISMNLRQYKREWTQNFEYVYCYVVLFKVL